MQGSLSTSRCCRSEHEDASEVRLASHGAPRPPCRQRIRVHAFQILDAARQWQSALGPAACRAWARVGPLLDPSVWKHPNSRISGHTTLGLSQDPFGRNVHADSPLSGRQIQLATIMSLDIRSSHCGNLSTFYRASLNFGVVGKDRVDGREELRGGETRSNMISSVLHPSRRLEDLPRVAITPLSDTQLFDTTDGKVIAVKPARHRDLGNSQATDQPGPPPDRKVGNLP